jgi:hypothetical protein
MLKINPYRPTQIIEHFNFISTSEMTYVQLGPDGTDTCRFVRVENLQP